MDLSFYNSYYEVNLKTIKENALKIKNNIDKTEIIPVLKANAYGMGLDRIASTLFKDCGINVFACSQVSEGIVMRQSGVTCPILVLGPVPVNAIPFAVSYDLQIPVFTQDGVKLLAEEALKQSKTAKAQIKIESGMNRIGVKTGEPLENLLKLLKKTPQIEITGAYTHYVQADIPHDSFTLNQYEIFKDALKQISDFNIDLNYIHTCNTSASEWFDEAVSNSTHIRVGSLILGYSDISDYSNPMNVKEALSWRTSITDIHTVEKGDSVGYGRFFKPQRTTKIALAPIGFGDGLYNILAKNKGPVLINDSKTAYLDTCMDQCFIDVTDIDCKVGDPVTVFGYSPNGLLLSPKEFSSYGQIYTSYTSTGGLRAKRIYID